MGASQRSPIMEKADTVLNELNDLQASLGTLAEYISPYCTKAAPLLEEPKAAGGDTVEVPEAPLERRLGDAAEKVRMLRYAVDDLIARLR